MEKQHTSYKCKRCNKDIGFYSNIKKHINKKKICEKYLDAINYSDDQLLVCTLLPYINDIHTTNDSEIEHLKESNIIFENKDDLIEILDNIDKQKIKKCKFCKTQFIKSHDLKKHIILNCFHENNKLKIPDNNKYTVSPDGKNSSFSAIATNGNPINLTSIPNICIPGFGNNNQPFNIIESIINSIKDNEDNDYVEIKEITCNTVRSGINNCDTTNNINIRIEIKNIYNYEEIINVLRKTLLGLNLLTNDVIEEVLVNIKKVIEQKQLEYKKAMLSYLISNMFEMKLQEELELLEYIRNKYIDGTNIDSNVDSNVDSNIDANVDSNVDSNVDTNKYTNKYTNKDTNKELIEDIDDFHIGEIKINEDYYNNGRFEY